MLTDLITVYIFGAECIYVYQIRINLKITQYMSIISM